MKLRRDEFDVLTNSHRQGWRNRNPAKGVAELTNYLDCFSFNELTDIVISIIENNESGSIKSIEREQNIIYKTTDFITEDELEQIINYQDKSARIIVNSTPSNERIYNHNIIQKLKKLYHYQCQICGYSFESSYNINYAEAHHIDFFTNTYNNNASNIIILCPNHHRIIHKLIPVFNRQNMTWNYPNGLVELLKCNIHL